jgi:hypothetical protein
MTQTNSHPSTIANQWAAVDRYFRQLSLSDLLDTVMAANKAAELPAIDVAPNQGKLLQLLSSPAREEFSNRYARRLQHDLAGARVVRRRPIHAGINAKHAKIAAQH